MRIAITTLTTSSQPLGVGRYLVSLINALQKIDRENRYFVYTSADNFHLFDIWADNFSEIRTLFTHNPRWVMRPAYFIWQNTWLLWSLQRNKVDVLHLPNLLPLLSHKLPVVVTIHDLGEFKIEKKYNRLRQWYRQSILPLTVQNARRVITVSKSTQSDLREFLGVSENKIDLTYEGVNTALFKSVDSEMDQAVCEKYVRTPFVFYAGAMFKHKNLESLIRAFCYLKKSKDIPHKLVISGKLGSEYPTLLKLIQDLNLEDEVVFTGYVSDQDLACLYRCATLFVYVPLNEGFGLPILEAMACGTPVLASEVSSIPEVAGDAAILVDPLNIEAIASEISQVIMDEEKQKDLIFRGKKRVEMFTWQNCARMTLESYKRAILKQ